MSIETQIRTIQALGYSQPEAQFLRLVALHSGYFVRRQFLRAIDGRRGKRDQDFIDQLLGLGHAVREIFREDRHLFRLQSKVIYEALGEEDSRNRREHQPSTVRLRLMGLDFILEHPERRYLMTQEERLSYFLTAEGSIPKRCPHVSFDPTGQLRPAASRMDSHSLSRVVTRPAYRLFTSMTLSSAPTPFGPTCATTGTCFRALGAVGLVFVTTSPDRFEVGQKALTRFMSRARESAIPAIDLSRLLAHFPHRLLFEKRETRVLNGAQMRALAEDIHTLCGPFFDQLYEVWKQAGDEGLRAEYKTPPSPRGSTSHPASWSMIMTFLEPSTPLPSSAFQPFHYPTRAVNPVNPTLGSLLPIAFARPIHPAGSRSINQINNVKPQLRARIPVNASGTGAGATPVLVAIIRHDTSLARSLSLVGRSRTCPSSLIPNPNAIHREKESLRRTRHHGNSHS